MNAIDPQFAEWLRDNTNYNDQVRGHFWLAGEIDKMNKEK